MISLSSCTGTRRSSGIRVLVILAFFGIRVVAELVDVAVRDEGVGSLLALLDELRDCNIQSVGAHSLERFVGGMTPDRVTTRRNRYNEW